MNANILLFSIFLPITTGGFCLLVPTKRVKETITVAVTLINLILAVVIFLARDLIFSTPWITSLNINFSLRSYSFSSFILLFITLFAFLISLYSIKFMKGKSRLREYYAYFLWTLGASCGAILASNMVVFLFFWGTLGLLLYAFLSLGSARLSLKGFFTVGAADFALILGMLFLHKLSGHLEMTQISGISLSSGLAISAFVLLTIGALAKAGAMPFHTWIPDASQEVPLPFMALLPASLDKLLGIYFLTRICLDFFKLIPNSGLSILLMIIGSLTIVVAVMAALVQHDLKKLLSYHAISQVGYMVLGIGTGIPLAMAGGIFHMVNHAIYKSSLFLGGGAVEYRAGTTDLDKLGGLAHTMPITFITFLIAAFSISGVPPFNGFFSKWMIYQGVIQGGLQGPAGGSLWIVWLTAAMFGSALTLASFMKLIHAIFLGTSAQKSGTTVQNSLVDPEFSMSFPMIVLAALCVIFGIFAYAIPLRLFVFPAVPALTGPVTWLGFWKPDMTTLLIIIGLIGGGIIYLSTKVRGFRESAPYVGGEEVTAQMKVSGVEFYDTVRDLTGLRYLYRASEKGLLDIYQGTLQFTRAIAYFLLGLDRLVDYMWRGLAYVVLLAGEGISLLHTGVLHTYLAWSLLGLVLLLLLFLH